MNMPGLIEDCGWRDGEGGGLSCNVGKHDNYVLQLSEVLSCIILFTLPCWVWQ